MSSIGTVNVYGGNNQFGDYNVQGIDLTGAQVHAVLVRAARSPGEATVVADSRLPGSRRAEALSKAAGVSLSVATGIVAGVAVDAMKKAFGLPF